MGELLWMGKSHRFIVGYRVSFNTTELQRHMLQVSAKNVTLQPLSHSWEMESRKYELLLGNICVQHALFGI